jgi:hypothetical protein
VTVVASDAAGLLTAMRADDGHVVGAAVEQASFVALIGEADVGKTTLLRQLGTRMERSGMWTVRLDLDGAYAVAQLAWLTLRSLAEAIAGPVSFSMLVALDQSMWTSRARRAALEIDELLGTALSATALRATPPASEGKEEDLGLLGEALSRVADVAAVRQPVLLVIDHLEAPGLTPRHPVDVATLLWSVRAIAQKTPQVRVVVAGRPGIEDLYATRDAAFFQDGRTVRLERPSVTQWWQVASALGLPSDPFRSAIDLTEGHVPTTLRVLEEWSRERGAQVETLFAELVSAQAAHTRRCVQHARTLDRLGGRILTAISRGLPPYGAIAYSHPKEIQRPLTRLRLAGLIDQPTPRRWRVTDPLVGANLRAGLDADAWAAIEGGTTSYEG